jgi:VWFA-related protein
VTPAAPVVPVAQDEGPAPELGAASFTLHTRVNFVEVPFTVKDSKNRLVPGLTWRDIRIYENGLRQQPTNFTVDPYPLAVALVIDQSMTSDEMQTVNMSLSALQGAFAAYDEVAVFTFNKFTRLQTTFTAAQGARLQSALENSKNEGRDILLPGSLSGPLSQNTVINGYNVDPNTAANRNHDGMTLNAPREVHPLNDAILEAAKALAKVPRGKRRVIYVISDGKEAGSVAKYKEVVKFLQTNNIGVYATLVGDSAIPGLGFLDRIHLPLQMRDNILPLYTAATGGQVDAEFRKNGIEKSFARLAEEVRTQYMIGYYTHEPFIDGKYRSIEVKVLRPNLTVIAKSGYWPAAVDAHREAPATADTMPPAPSTPAPPAAQ